MNIMLKLDLSQSIKSNEVKSMIQTKTFLTMIQEKNIEPLLKNREEQNEISLSKGDMIFLISIYKQLFFQKYTSLYNSKPFKSTTQCFFINELLRWKKIFDTLYLSKDDLFDIKKLSQQSEEIEVYSLIYLYNNVDWEREKLYFNII